MSTKLALLVGATLLALVFGSVGIAAAQADVPRVGTGILAEQGARLYGVIETVEGQSLTLTTPVGPVVVVTDANTLFRIPDVEKSSLDDGSTELAEILAIGDYVGAAGWWEEERGEGSVFHAFGMAWVEPDHVFPLAGKLTEVSDDTLTVETEHGLASVRADDETVVRVRGVEESSLDDLEVGMRIVAKGTLDQDGSLLAQVVAVPWAGPRPIRLRGQVLTIEEGAFTVCTAGGRHFSVLVDEATEFRVSGVDNPSIADLQVGDKVAGKGVVEGDRTVRATLVVVMPEQVMRLIGEVIAVEGATLELDTPGGTVHVLTGADTVVRVPGVEEPGLDDVKIGDRITAAGIWVDELTFQAIGVGVRAGRRVGQPGTVRGRAIHVGTETLVLGTQHGPLTVLVEDETRYRVPGVDSPRLGDVQIGAMVSARGTWNEDGTLQATGVAVMDSGRACDDANKGRPGHP